MDVLLVSIHTRHYWRVKPFAQVVASRGYGCFNPHPPLLAGETDYQAACLFEAGVSIHTRHYWRVKRPPAWPRCPATCFNPHPPLLAGETDHGRSGRQAQIVSIHTRHYWRVKQIQAATLAKEIEVSIHTRHYWRVKPHDAGVGKGGTAVSIHTRHYWRVKRDSGGVACAGTEGFNPHPPLLAGETTLQSIFDALKSFQSTPAITGG